ncbi:two component transcriptional regulator, winged helix family protein [Neobacillus bataviensis LMG 21833]|uniref:Heme response regulator HssR n=1 Tax=Neobacillus bataviensis LMG 21833 TaxID=1117379 RepID=K6DCY5_9BACI|nr:response regulator transcription factor [Neobacillus bataviensis]EKN65933.1 two component transcriptional regulator, winged helix family protein [Neobacillus bataviensis LMG 21833]
MKPTILIADDDPNIRMVTQLYLEKEGYHTKIACHGKEALNILEEEKIDCAVIDLMMPNIDGWQLCEKIKSYYEIPVLILTARAESDDIIKGFQIGTDDYVTKPFHPGELVMRVKSLLKRYRVIAVGNLTFNHITIDSSSYKVQIKNEVIMLPVKQFEVLYLLASYPGKIFTRDQLIERIWGLDYEGDERTVDSHIKKLRKQLNEYEDLLQIVTVRGLGYKVEIPS